MKMLKTYYHATPYENLESILDQGILRGCDGVVYLTEQPDEAARFVAIRGCKKILVLGIEMEENMVEESFDHSQIFFKCRAYMHKGDIPADEITEFLSYDLNKINYLN